GTGAFTFVEHAPKSHWTAKRWDKYFLPGRPYLDGYTARFMGGAKTIEAFKKGEIMAEFRSVTPVQREDLVGALGDKINAAESPWLIDLMVVFNVKRPPFDDARV